MLNWLDANKEWLIGLFFGSLVPAYKAWKAGRLNAFLVEQMKPHLPDERSKEWIRAKAIEAGVQPLLAKVVKSGTVLVAVLAMCVLAGCATGEAGQATSPVDARLIIEWPAIAVGDTMPNISIVATMTTTITPSSTATQTPTNTTSTEATIPASVIP